MYTSTELQQTIWTIVPYRSLIAGTVSLSFPFLTHYAAFLFPRYYRPIFAGWIVAYVVSMWVISNFLHLLVLNFKVLTHQKINAHFKDRLRHQITHSWPNAMWFWWWNLDFSELHSRISLGISACYFHFPNWL